VEVGKPVGLGVSVIVGVNEILKGFVRKNTS